MRSKGFTLIELLIVVAIIGLLASYVMYTITSANIRVKIAQAKTQISHIENTLELYNGDVGFYPPGDAVYDGGIINVVEALSGKPRSEGGGGGPSRYWEFKEKELANSKYEPSRKVLLDPWGKPYRYTRATDDAGNVKPGIHRKSSFDLYSCGPDGVDQNGENDKKAGKDDINNWTGE
jgi:general secretion pathway protein G